MGGHLQIFSILYGVIEPQNKAIRELVKLCSFANCQVADYCIKLLLGCHFKPRNFQTRPGTGVFIDESNDAESNEAVSFEIYPRTSG